MWGVYKVSYKGTNRYRLFKVVFNSSDLGYDQDAMEYMTECLVGFGFA